MKKLFLLAITALIAVSYTGQLLAEGSKGIALALKVKGDVKLTRDGKTAPLKFGTPLNHGDDVQTGTDGFVAIMFTDDKSIIKLTAGTKITLEGKRDAGGNIAKRISMEIGNLYAKVEKQRGSLEVATPTSVASVKGTVFFVVYDEKGNTYVTTLVGVILLLNLLDGSEIDVAAAQRGTIDADGNVTLEDIPPDELPRDPDPTPPGAELKTIEIDVRDENGERTIQIQYFEQKEDE